VKASNWGSLTSPRNKSEDSNPVNTADAARPAARPMLTTAKPCRKNTHYFTGGFPEWPSMMIVPNPSLNRWL
jgi:hypothetical protein